MFHSALRLLACAALAAGPLAVSPLHAAIPAPPTREQQADWRDHGRTLPERELLQPSLDPALPPYTPRAGVELTGHFKGAASDVLAELTQRWIAAFRKLHPAVTIDVPPPYAGSLGALELIKGDLDFVMVSRELKPTDISEFHQKFGYDPFSAPISGGTWRHFGFLDSVVFLVHEDNPIKQVTLAQLDALLSTTRHRGAAEIRTWGQLGLTGDWADQPIHVWAIKPWNGFEEFVRQRVLSVGGGATGPTASQRGEWRTDLNFVETVFPVSPAVAKDRYALGYSGRAYIGDGVKLLPLAENETGPAIAPGYENVARATYPLSRVCYVNLNKAPGKPLNPALAEFVRFILSREGQQVILNQAVFLPLRANQVANSRALLETK
jgi:phosphate transport system substrate-binding protein